MQPNLTWLAHAGPRKHATPVGEIGNPRIIKCHSTSAEPAAMASTPRNSPDHLHDRIDLAAAWRFLMRERVRYVIAWLAALVGAAICLYGSWISLDDSDRADGNGGHMNL